MIEVYGNHGTLFVDIEGNVVEYQEEETATYDCIVKVDLEEWKRTYPDESVDNIDILDIGTWDKFGKYEPAEEDWRKEVQINIERKGE